MLYLYTEKECKDCAAIRERLEELVLAYKSIETGGSAELPVHLPEDARPPVLIDGEMVVQGKQAILKHLEKMAQYKAEWDKFQSDACYIRGDGKAE